MRSASAFPAADSPHTAAWRLLRALLRGELRRSLAPCFARCSHPPLCRAVGNALRHNPFAPIVPCHRVLKSDFSLGGFSGQTDPLSNEVCRKRELLKEEGVPLEKDSVRVSERARLVFDFDGARVSEGEMSPDALRVA